MSRIFAIAGRQGPKLLKQLAKGSFDTMAVERFGDYAQREPNLVVIDIINAIAEADPTPQHKYMQWLVNQYLNEEFRLEDVDRVKHELKQFLTIQKKLLQPDLGQYTYAQMSDTVNKAYGNVTLIDEVSDLHPDIKVLHSSELGSIMIPTTFEAAQILSRGTKWCTGSSSSNFEFYSTKGPLYVIRMKNGDKYQLHIETNQYMDAQDRSIQTVDELILRLPAIGTIFEQQLEAIVLPTVDEPFPYNRHTSQHEDAVRNSDVFADIKRASRISKILHKQIPPRIAEAARLTVLGTLSYIAIEPDGATQKDLDKIKSCKAAHIYYLTRCANDTNPSEEELLSTNALSSLLYALRFGIVDTTLTTTILEGVSDLWVRGCYMALQHQSDFATGNIRHDVLECLNQMSTTSTSGVSGLSEHDLRRYLWSLETYLWHAFGQGALDGKQIDHLLKSMTKTIVILLALDNLRGRQDHRASYDARFVAGIEPMLIQLYARILVAYENFMIQDALAIPSVNAAFELSSTLGKIYALIASDSNPRGQVSDVYTTDPRAAITHHISNIRQWPSVQYIIDRDIQLRAQYEQGRWGHTRRSTEYYADNINTISSKAEAMAHALQIIHRPKFDADAFNRRLEFSVLSDATVHRIPF